MENVCGMLCKSLAALRPEGTLRDPAWGVWVTFWTEKSKEAEWGQWSEEGRQKVAYEGGIRKSQ